MRVVVAEDHALLRAGLVELLTTAEFDVVGQVGDAEHLLELVRSTRPDVVLLDIRMPPTHTLEGLRAARKIRAEYGATIGIVLLTQHIETHHAVDLLADGASGIGYLLKDRVLDPADLADAITRVGAGGSAIDPVVIEHLLRRKSDDAPLVGLTDREHEVLAGMAEGRSNHSIAAKLFISEKTVEACTGRIFSKLGLEQHPDDHRRVRAVLAYLHATETLHEQTLGPGEREPRDSPPNGVDRVGDGAPAKRMLTTVLFVDIVDSTKQLNDLGDERWVVELDRFEATVRNHLERFGGELIKLMGDGAVAVFASPAAAIGCASAVCDEVDRLGLRLRAGVHTGEIERRGVDIAGITVHIAARLATVGEPGEVLVSRTVTDLAGGSSIRFVDRGERELKGIATPIRVFAVTRD